MMVVTFHSTETWAAQSWKNGASGVDIFFVISGFVMSVSAIGREKNEHPARSFMERRLIRIAPLYWLLTTVFLLKLLLLGLYPTLESSSTHLAVSFPYLLASFLFIPYRSSLGTIQPPLLVGWTLSYEMFFYLLFAGALAMRKSPIRILTPVMILLAIVGLFHQDRWPAISVLADPRLLEFLAGVWLGQAVAKGVRVNPWLSGTLGLVGLVAITCLRDLPGGHVIWFGIPAVLLVQAAVMLEGRIGRLWPRWSLALGDASYSLYLSHLLVFTALFKIVARTHLLAPGGARMRDEAFLIVGTLLCCVLVSMLVYRWVEKPMNRYLRRRFIERPRPGIAA